MMDRRGSLVSSIQQIMNVQFKRTWQSTEYNAQRPFIETCKFCNDDKLVVLSGSDGTLRYFDVDSGNVSNTRICDYVIWHVDCSEDDTYVCTCDAGRQVTVWERNGMVYVAKHLEHNDTVWRVKFTKDCNHVISCSSDLRIIIWNFKENSTRVLIGHLKTVEDITLSRSGVHLASSSQDKSIRIWTDLTLTKEPECSAVLKGHKNRVTSCVFAPHREEILASTSADCTIVIWDVLGQRQMIRLKGHHNIIWSCAFLKMKFQTFLVSCSSDHSVRFWNISTGDEIRRVKDFYLYEGVPSQLLCCQVSNSGKKIAVTTADGALYMGEIGDLVVAEACASARLKE